MPNWLILTVMTHLHMLVFFVLLRHGLLHRWKLLNRVRDNCQAATADRLSGDNKGGVIVSFSDTIRLGDFNNASLENNTMEIMVTVVRLPSGQCFQLVVIYRSPSVSVDTVLQTMTNLLSMVFTNSWHGVNYYG